MRNRLALTVLFLAANCAFAETPKPNTLSAQEIAEGWILLFDGEKTFGWKAEGGAKVENSQIIVDADKTAVLQTTTPFGWFEMKFIFAYSDGKPDVQLRDYHFALPKMDGKVGITADATGYRTSYLGNGLGPDSTAHGHVELLKQRGPAAIRFNVPAGCRLSLSDIKLRPLGLDSLFNAKDLTGWKQYTGDPNRMKSKFTVTKEGWLNVQDGSGDLQTESQYADFVFQGECISNGKHLNSGLFFRCLPGQYLQGYEMQIRNEWKGDDRTKPVDFGTGSIYRRQPARKVVSTDGEWFTMTIAAHGRHIATWIDGYQVCDWTDPRPEKDNAREGAKLGKGHFSIQGHDPTTNLSFRNMRVAEMKK